MATSLSGQVIVDHAGYVGGLADGYVGNSRLSRRTHQQRTSLKTQVRCARDERSQSLNRSAVLSQGAFLICQ